MPDYTSTDIIDYCVSGDVVKLQYAIDDIMKEKISDLLHVKKIEVAKSLFNPEDQNA